MMKVKINLVLPDGIRPGSSRVCIIDARDNHQCWFDVSNGASDCIWLEAGHWAPANKMIYFRFPEEADNGRYGAWVCYDDIAEKEQWLLDAMMNDAGRLAAIWLRENWNGVKFGQLPKELAELIHLSVLTSSVEQTFRSTVN